MTVGVEEGEEGWGEEGGGVDKRGRFEGELDIVRRGVEGEEGGEGGDRLDECERYWVEFGEGSRGARAKGLDWTTGVVMSNSSTVVEAVRGVKV